MKGQDYYLCERRGDGYFLVTENIFEFPKEGFWKVEVQEGPDQRLMTLLCPLEEPRAFSKLRFLRYQRQLVDHLTSLMEEEMMSLEEMVSEVLIKLEQLSTEES